MVHDIQQVKACRTYSVCLSACLPATQRHSHHAGLTLPHSVDVHGLCRPHNTNLKMA